MIERDAVQKCLALISHIDFCCGLLLRNLLQLQQQNSDRNHAKMQLQQNTQQTWLQVTQMVIYFNCWSVIIRHFLMSVRKS